MIDIAWSEFLFIAVLALILIGPKELPAVLKTAGRWVGKARTLAKNFYEQIEGMAEHEKKPLADEAYPKDKNP